MKFKMIVAFVDEAKTDEVLDAAREAGAMGATIINHARGEGVSKKRTFFGLSLDVQRDVIMLVVEGSLAKAVLDSVCVSGEFDSTSGQGIAVQLDLEDAVGVAHQVAEIQKSHEL